MKTPNQQKVQKKSIEAVIFNWKGKYENTCELVDQIKDVVENVSVINSDQENKKPDWINVFDSCYFSDLFKFCLKFRNTDKILFHVQGDVSYEKWNKLVEDAVFYMNEYNAGIYYPIVENTEWANDRITCVQGAETRHDNIKVIANGDETVWFIRPEVLNELTSQSIHQAFEGNKFGWGWDIVLCALSFINSMPVIRDSNHIVNHPKSTNYNKSLAIKEYEAMQEKLPKEIQDFIYHTTKTGKRYLFRKYINM